MRVHPEHRSQCAVIQWARHYAIFQTLYAIPNGEKRERVAYRRKDGSVAYRCPTGQRLKSEGQLAGMPDLCLPLARHGFHALYIEMKAPGKNPTETQRGIHFLLRAEGNMVVVCSTSHAAIKTLTEYVGMELPF